MRHLRSLAVLAAVFLTVAVAAAVTGSARAAGSPVELIQNGGFESGSLAPWTTTTTGDQYCVGGQSGWRVAQAGSSAGNCMHSIQPANGNWEVLNSFDGDGPFTLTLSQVVTIPAHATATLSWKDWIDVNYFDATARIFTVAIRDAATDAVLATLYSYSVPTFTQTNTGWLSHSVDASAFDGQTVKVSFSAFVPQSYTGPGQLDLDSISLQAIQNDTTPPVFGALPSPTVEATSADGATVSYDTPTVTDDTDASPTVSCAPASGSAFPIGDTLVTCTASDATGNASQATFDVIVSDTTAPELTLPSSKTAEATSPAGAAVAFSASATDIVDGSAAVTCSSVSGSTFAVGTTTVTCSSTDAHGNTSSGSFDMTVSDTTAPVLTLPSNKTVDATSPAGAAVAFSASATDIVDGSTAVTCSPASGSTFAVGTTTVSCSSTDAHGNTSSGSFSVTVRGASAMLASLAGMAAGLPQGTSIPDKIASAQTSLAAGDTSTAIATLKALVKELSAQSGKKLTTAQAISLSAATKAVIAVLGG